MPARPRPGAPRELESAGPPGFAQGVGLVLALVATAGYATGTGWLGNGAADFAPGTAFLNAAFGFCLGCEMYMLIRRSTCKIRSDREVPA
ncbi:DUF4395 domain-containing protein [Actinomadura sp. NPDC047616]|uniref:DUF4395 domain-containing protein n=1 Tax=Actinomadura sp. NPDC047616 TaxID=3155914 RepID=UPI0033D158DD